MTEEKKNLSFGGGLLIYITVMLTLIFVLLAVWWHYLGCLEAGRYEGVMDVYMTNTLEQVLTETAEQLQGAKKIVLRTYQFEENVQLGRALRKGVRHPDPTRCTGRCGSWGCCHRDAG